MGGKFAGMTDNREVPDTLEVLWHYPGDTLVTFSQFNATAPSASRQAIARSSSAAPRARSIFITNGYEVVPDIITPNEFPARTPLDRVTERG